MEQLASSEMDLHKAAQAARNNARWCDAVCQAHGTPGVWQDALWFNPRAVPRFYPNAVTLRPRQAQALGAMLNQLPAHCAVKDSFDDLRLGDAGFHLLFEASWLWRPAARPAPPAMTPDVRWVRVSDGEQLTHWERTWAGEPSGSVDAPPASARVFLPEMLADPTTAFLGAWQGEQMLAGVIANETAGVVGLSNLFVGDVDRDGSHRDAAGIWAGSVAAIAALFPGRDLVGYERGDDLILARSAGFEPTGLLRVWAR